MGIMSNYLHKQKLNTILLFIVFYSIGVAGVAIPVTQAVFVRMIPVALLMSFVAILLFHRSLNSQNTRFVFFTIILVSYLVEVIGANSHFIFGNYIYGNGLGIKLFNTPLVIGINWAMLVYCSASILERLRLPVGVQIFFSSVLIVLYDIVLESVAPFLDMWYWNENSVPLQHYLIWFVIALVFHGLVKWKKVKTENPLAPAIFICQFLFFIAILTFIK